MRISDWSSDVCSSDLDPVAARTRVAKYGDYVYRELQYGLRKAVAAKTLGELLGDKATLDAEIFAYVRCRVEVLGIEVSGVGVKDVILPGGVGAILHGDRKSGVSGKRVTVRVDVGGRR